MLGGGSAASVAVDGGDLPLGGGLLAILRPALDLLETGGVLALISSNASVRDNLPRWCALEHNRYLGREAAGDEKDRHLVERGPLAIPRGPREQGGLPLFPAHDGRPTAAGMMAAAPMPEHADPATGFAPRGARVEPGGPVYPFDLLDRDRAASPEIAELYDQAVASQWDATRDIPWSKIRPLSPVIDRALSQVMTFLAENELSALYVPSRFIARIHPAFVEVAQFLATQMVDEARHIDCFLRRARGGQAGIGVSSVTTAQSLLFLLEIEDFTEAAFMLSVLGEGTFLDLFRFIEQYSPDEPTAEMIRRARADESRHVHFGLAHIRHALAHDPTLYGRLEASVRRRAAMTAGSGAGVPAPLQDGLVLLAAGSDDPSAVARGHERFRELLIEMHENRTKRLENAGFTPEQARTLSELHTPNFM